MALTDFAIIRRSMWSRRLATIVSALSVSVAVALLCVLLSMRDAGQRAFQRGTGNMHILVSAEQSPLAGVLNAVYYAGPPQRKITVGDLRSAGLVGASLGAAPADGRVAWTIPVQLGDSFRGFKTLATIPDFFSKFEPAAGTPWIFAQGSAFKDTWEIVLGAESARVTGLRLGEVIFVTHGWSDAGHAVVAGDTPATTPVAENAAAPKPGVSNMEEAPDIHREHPFKVVGILGPTGLAHDRAIFLPIEASWILHAEDNREAEEAAKTPASGAPKAGEAEEHHEHIEVKDLRPAEQVLSAAYVRCKSNTIIGAVFSGLRARSDMTAALPANQVRDLLGIVSSIDRILLAMAAVVLIGSGATVLLAMYGSMEQRRRQVAVLRVLGASRLRILGLVLTESAVIAAAGAAAGVVIAQGGMWLASTAFAQATNIIIPASIDFGWGLIVAVGAVLVGALAGTIPALRAYGLSVVEGLRPVG
ncbi:ABC transporter permease [soil metagenome]